jgi:hypothetical protein
MASWLFRPACRHRSESARAGSEKSLQIIFPKEPIIVCFRGGKAPTRRNLGEASLISFVMVAKVSSLW